MRMSGSHYAMLTGGYSSLGAVTKSRYRRQAASSRDPKPPLAPAKPLVRVVTTAQRRAGVRLFNVLFRDASSATVARLLGLPTDDVRRTRNPNYRLSVPAFDRVVVAVETFLKKVWNVGTDNKTQQ